MSVRPWQLISSETVFDAGFLRVHRDRARSPRSDAQMDFTVLQMVDWLMVVPITQDGNLVMVRQYRHGSRSVSLEVPGGLHDVKAQSPREGAARELLEETGYDRGRLVCLGVLSPQAALFANRMHVFLAQDVRRVAEARPDPGEDIELVLIGREDVEATLTGGAITNAMSVAALALARFAGYI